MKRVGAGLELVFGVRFGAAIVRQIAHGLLMGVYYCVCTAGLNMGCKRGVKPQRFLLF